MDMVELYCALKIGGTIVCGMLALAYAAVSLWNRWRH